ncbi:MAG: biosynthetic-type acetolactate synthase large subunit [Dehalococcoidaceae bacterium]|nr:biosynthetic-type acetolactate synthase large subunit [Dehalococcoidaceae bacterium]
MKMTGSQILCESLIKEGVDVIFGILGGSILPLYDTLTQYPQLRHVLVRHEQAAAHAAASYARVTGKPGVCFATSGPGATNLVTGIADAYLDSTPVIAITGQVARPFIGKDAFQEIDITGITLPITKHNYLVTDAGQVAQTVKEAFYIARTGRPGPVLIDMPKDVQVDMAEFDYSTRLVMPGYKPTTQGHPSQLKKAARVIQDAAKPVILAGHGVIIAEAYDELKEMAENNQIPVITTLLGISAFPGSHFLSYGWLGMHGMACANMAIDACDLVIAVGMRFDDRATGKISGFAPHAKVIHIDIDPAEIGKNVKVDVPIVGDVKAVLKGLNKYIEPKQNPEWLSHLEALRLQHPALHIGDSDSILPQYAIRKIWEATEGRATVITGVGQHQMWTAQYYTFDRPNTLVTSGGLGTMGFELPASVGAAVGRPGEDIWCIAGDGSIQMTIQELATIVQENLPVKIAIMNNGYLGMVRQWQEMFYGKRYMATPLACPDFTKIAEAYCIPAINIKHRQDVEPAIQRAIEHPGSFLLNFVVEPEENVYPMVPPGASLAEVMETPRKEVLKWPRKSTL